MNLDLLNRCKIAIIAPLITAIIMAIRQPDSLDTYTASFLFIVALSVAITLWFERSGTPALITIGKATIILLNMGVALQAISVNDATYINILISVSLLFGVGIAIIYERFNDILDKILLLLSSSVSLVIYITLIGTGALGYTNTTIFGLQVVLIQIPLYCITIACIFYKSEWTSTKKYVIVSAMTILHTLALVITNELGTAMIILGIYFIMTFLALKVKYVLISILTIVMITIAFIGIGLTYLSSNPDTDNQIVNLFVNIWTKLVDRFIVIFNPKEFQFDESYQLMQARRAIAIGGLLGSSESVPIPVAESDYAFPNMVLHFGIIAAFVLLMLFVLVLSQTKVLIEKKDLHSFISVSFLYAIAIQAIINLIASLGLLPFAGMPLAIISKSGVAFILFFVQLFFVGTKTREKEANNINAPINKIVRQQEVSYVEK